MQNNVNQTTERTKSGNGNGKWAQSQKAVESGVEGVTESARKIYSEAVDAGSDLLDQANKRANQAADVVREYPIYAMFAGVCVGFLLGAGLFRRSAVKEG